MNSRRWIPLMIVVAGMAAYHNCFQGQFILDDIPHIVNNPQIREICPPWAALTGTSRPVVQFSLALNFAFGELNPWGYHLFNLIVHLLAGLTLYGVLRRTFLCARKDRGLWTVDCRLANGGTRSVASSADADIVVPPAREPRLADRMDDEPGATGTVALKSSVVGRQSSVISPAHSAMLAGVIALIWVVHPLNTQAVTYIIQRGESMMGLFYLLTLYCFIRGVGADDYRLSTDDCRPNTGGPRSLVASSDDRTQRSASLQSLVNSPQFKVHSLANRCSLWSAASLLACILGMATKPIMVTVPLMILAYDWIFVAGSISAIWIYRRWYYVGLMATWLVLPLLLYAGRSEWSGSAGFGTETITWDVYACSQPRVILRYLLLVVNPVGLCLDYTWPVQRGFMEITPSLTVVGLLLAFTIWSVRRRSTLAYCGIWFFGILSMTSSVLPVADLAVEHRMYLPLIAPITLMVLGGYWLVQYRIRQNPLRTWLVILVATGILTAVVVRLTKVTMERNRDYHDRFQMWVEISSQRPHNYRALTALADLHVDRNETDRAIELGREVIEKRDPSYFPAHMTLGRAYFAQGRDDIAWRHLEKAVALYPPFSEAYNLMGLIRYRQAQYTEADSLFSKAIGLADQRYKYHHNHGLVLMKLGRWPEAEAAFREATRLQPGNFESHHGIGYVCAMQAKYAEAIDSWYKALEINPSFVPSVYDLAWVLATSPNDDERNGKEALKLAQRLADGEQSPSASCLEVLAAAYAETGQFDKAVVASEQLQSLPAVAGQSVIPSAGRTERLALYRLGKRYRMVSTNAGK